MKDHVYSTVAAVLSGLANLVLWTGYDSQAFIVESVLHSVHDRQEDMVGPYDGYYGLAAMNIVYMVSNLFVPCISQHMRSKWNLTIGAFCLAIYFLSFQFLHRILFFCASGALGFGFALFNVGYMGYLTEISTRQSLERNQALSWMFSCMSVFGAGVLYMFITSATSTVRTSSYREYSDLEIRSFYIAYAVCAVGGMVMSSLLPNRDVDNSIAAERKSHLSVTVQLKWVFSVVVHRRTLLLLPFYLYVGLFFSFWTTVFPTTIQFTAALSEHIYLPAYFGMMFSTGSVLMSMATLQLSKRIDNFGLRPVMYINAVVHMSAFALITASIPEWSTVRPNNDQPLLIEPNVPTNLLIAFLFGVGDAANNTSRTMLASLVIPDSKQQSFATSRMFHAMAAGVLFFASPSLSVYSYMILLASFLSAACVSVWYASGLVMEDELRSRPEWNSPQNPLTRNTSKVFDTSDNNLMKQSF